MAFPKCYMIRLHRGKGPQKIIWGSRKRHWRLKESQKRAMGVPIASHNLMESFSRVSP